MSLFTKNRFTAGELSPLMEGNHDTEEFQNGLRTLENFIVIPQGGVKHRCGTKHVAEAIDSTKKSRLIPFEFSEEDAYVLEFSDRAIRIYKESGVVSSLSNLVSNYQFDSDVSGWTDYSTGTSSMTWDSTEQAMKLGGGTADYGFASIPITVTNTSILIAKLRNPRMFDSSGVPGNSVAGPSIQVGTTSLVSGYSGTTGNRVAQTFPGAFGYPIDIQSALAVTPGNYYLNIGFYTGTIGAGSYAIVDEPEVYELGNIGTVISPYDEADIGLIQYAQSNDVMYITHPDYPPYKLIRVTDSHWSFEPVSLFEQPYNVEENTITLTASGTTVNSSVTITASASYFSASHVGSYFRLRDTSETVKPKEWRPSHGSLASIYGEMEIAINDLVSWNGNTYQAATAGKTGTIPPTHGTGTVTDGSIDWLFVRASYGFFKVTHYISATSVTGLVISTLPHTSATTNWEVGEWNEVNGYPGSCCFFEERLWFAGTYSRPQTIWGSKTDDFEDFDYGSGNPSDAMQYTIASNTTNRIQWLQPGHSLFIGTLGGEYVASGGNQYEAITPTTIRIVNHSRNGSKRIMSRLVSNTAIFVQKAAKRIRRLIYSDKVGGYVSDDITLLSEHITGDTGVNQIDYQQEPNSLLLAVRNDGQLAASTYHVETGTNGWSRQIIGGSFGSGDAVVESVATVPTTNADRVWLIVKRTINGSTVRYIEYITQWDQDLLKDAIYMDSAITYDGVSTTTITGLDHLEGESVSILADGLVQANKTVSGGNITLDTAATKAQIGLYKNATLETMAMNPQTLRGKESYQGQIKRVSEVVIRFFKSVGGKLNGDDLDLTAGELYTGVKHQEYPDDYGYEASVKITQEQPLPMTILSIQPRAKEGR